MVLRCQIGDSYDSVLRLLRGADSIQYINRRDKRWRGLVARWNKSGRVIRFEFVDQKLTLAVEQTQIRDKYGRMVRRVFENSISSSPITEGDQAMSLEDDAPQAAPPKDKLPTRPARPTKRVTFDF